MNEQGASGERARRERGQGLGRELARTLGGKDGGGMKGGEFPSLGKEAVKLCFQVVENRLECGNEILIFSISKGLEIRCTSIVNLSGETIDLVAQPVERE